MNDMLVTLRHWRLDIKAVREHMYACIPTNSLGARRNARRTAETALAIAVRTRIRTVGPQIA